MLLIFVLSIFQIRILNFEVFDLEFIIRFLSIAILAGVINFLPQPSPRVRGGSKKFTNDLGLLYLSVAFL
jgi:hypothetical protein